MSTTPPLPAAGALASIEYEDALSQGDPGFMARPPHDEWDAIALSYTSGTTGNPKGVVTHHRGAYLNAVSNILAGNLGQHPVYLWTLPMFHCNGWCFPWTIAAAAGINVCMRKVDPAKIFELIGKHGVTHMCGAPIVYNTLINAPNAPKGPSARPVVGLIAGAAPPVAVLEGAERIGIKLTHVYGLTEVYGPASVCAEQPGWDELPAEQRAQLKRRQGVSYPLQEFITVIDPETMREVPRDGETVGEVMFRGNIVMKGYLKNEKATAEAFAGGWFHTGDLGVLDEHGYVIIKDRSKDIIISGGENISSVEVEDVLYRHPAVLFAAVVAKPDSKWGEVPCAFIELKDNARGPRRRSSRSAAVICRVSRRRRRWCSARSPRPRPARSRNSCCATRWIPPRRYRLDAAPQPDEAQHNQGRNGHDGKIICDATCPGGDGWLAVLFDGRVHRRRGTRRGQGIDVGSADIRYLTTVPAIPAGDRKQASRSASA